ncbi:lipopolysaccharide assembly protein LapA domain-containing protein [Streptococcus mitis]|uniref:Lipopolysaccharide assembly protein A domain-containing protein n=1 Tax=Streptococcus mitis TaxID=28037 RepID=A0A3R9IHA5_STRMT|nr:LapA family protein [Streptococcus mitis]RSI79682.1 hypothetical protein D8855_08570 [Streptococcus mitis]
MLKKFNELTLKKKAYLIGGLILLVIVTCFGLLNRQTVAVSLVFTQLSAPLILVIFTCLVIGFIAGSAIGISYHHGKAQELKGRIAEAEATIHKKDRELVQYKEQVQQLKQEAKQ